MHRAISLLITLTVLVVWAPALADSLTGKVVKITDGDTLYVLDANYQQHKIRLAGIDAPDYDSGETLKAQYLEAEAQRIVNMKNDPEGAYSPDMIKAAEMRLAQTTRGDFDHQLFGLETITNTDGKEEVFDHIAHERQEDAEPTILAEFAAT